MSIGGRIFIDFRFADYIFFDAEEEEEVDDILQPVWIKQGTRWRLGLIRQK